MYTGLVFLLFFFSWALIYIRSHARSVSGKVGQSIWGALVTSAAALLVSQIILQIIYAAGNADWATDPQTKRVLQLLGLSKAHGIKNTILVRTLAQKCLLC